MDEMQQPDDAPQMQRAVVIQMTSPTSITVTPVSSDGEPGKSVDCGSLDEAMDAARQALEEPDADDAGGPSDMDEDDAAGVNGVNAPAGDDERAAWDEEAKRRGSGIYEGR